ncbi:SDR family NAD(P)-dependent oxidoreductase [Quadrisphaera sp. KR29]|uniref:SDR family NAD(P)-dependent oxidoreductase n=1 Tax=Quadrisphaera sp. KR29 TaxID=3461391 RepID=UPI0040450084
MAGGSLTLDSTIATWLDDPHGGPLLRALLASGGQDERALAPVRLLPLGHLVAMSRGALPQEAIEGLLTQLAELRASNAPSESGKQMTAPLAAGDSGETATEQGVGVSQRPSARPEWKERITPERFAGQTLIVTGAGSGIGRATASRVAREGGRVIAVDVVAERVQGLVDELSSLPGTGEVVPVVADITHADGVALIVDAAGERVDALANIAGIMDDMTPVHEVSDAVWERVQRINVDGAMRLTRAVVPLMLAAGGGSVVNVASEAALRGSAAGVAYTTSKHAVVGLTKSSAVMYARLGIRVNAVAPGPVITGIEASFASALGAERIGGLLGITPPPVMPEQLAASITFLLSEDGVNITGVVLASDGGWSAQ